ncbi:MAG: hypothetical protein IKN15_06920 [Bacteroidaceae bacterium]|nr:hypothetical protein [Bacteroidaceae bacterium]MCR4836407.1 hypothetical protein [Bacteroidaceae bacterium]
MAKVFTCTLKESRAGMPKGTTIQVASNLSTPTDSQIADECERRFGKKARDASWHGYWNIQ